MISTRLLWMLVCGALMAGCGARPATKTAAPTRTVDMEEMVIEYQGEKDGKAVFDAFDEAQLFTQAKGLHDGQEFAQAEALYGKLIKYFPKSQYLSAALYNRGLCLEQIGQHAEAATHFRRYIQTAQNLQDQRDGEFRWGYNLVMTGNHPEALDLYNRLLDEKDLSDADRGEAYMRRAQVFLAGDRFGEAERDVKKSLEHTRKAYDNIVEGNPLYAEGHFRRGEIYQRLFRRVRLSLPVEKMEVDLADKIRFFRQSQNSFLDALNVRHPQWATAAGFKLGELYQQFHTDILSAEVPPDFDPEVKRYYFQALRAKLRPLVEQALTIYEKNITMSQRVGVQNEWVDQTETQLAKLRDLLEETIRIEKEMKSEDAGEPAADASKTEKPGAESPATPAAASPRSSMRSRPAPEAG